MSGSDKRRTFDRAFKIEAVRLIVEEGRPLAQVARDLGVHENQLYRWKKKYLAEGGDAFPGSGNRPVGEDEVARLRRENADLREERDILKKAIGIFTPRKR